ncbi:MAG: LPS export ABC transporter periplasmic protein LptC [Gammaproteobacteria bacterium]|jgi:LPS export ABC transporter protein LptC|nr:LPS export ABC transporter periplasmic protein LptC [Gammaproteobacteria bacterium]MBT3859918.1 LPS export ABC transporter periplasmic protein LptC [Gammaproteobacteria bacterium]MBT3986380.1 LPS export ABC transporter periplasmic protein LptC [Gammaproteobacteria bacterium]MBT4255027.1 LPS export ABC transporter periplasmic protein LptC [Gammaproteobacteria bacterium]MBT4582940.1 LPS export ABC transporter periplasmic protein LptC [Gammaproteobacteria bacterium]
MQRIRLLIIPTLVAVTLFVGISSFNSEVPLLDSEENELLLDYNAYSEGINTVLYDAQGNISYTLQASRQTTFKDETTELESPLIRLYEEGDSRWNIVAKSGKISAASGSETSSNQTIELSGNVEVFNLDAAGNRITMSTEFLSVNPELETLTTDNRVTVVTENLQQTSTGMIARLKTDEIVFLRDIRGQYAQIAN